LKTAGSESILIFLLLLIAYTVNTYSLPHIHFGIFNLYVVLASGVSIFSFEPAKSVFYTYSLYLIIGAPPFSSGSDQFSSAKSYEITLALTSCGGETPIVPMCALSKTH